MRLTIPPSLNNTIMQYVADGYFVPDIKIFMKEHHGIECHEDTLHRRILKCKKELQIAGDQARLEVARKVVIDHVEICEYWIDKLGKRAAKLLDKKPTLALACLKEMGAIQDRHLRIMGMDKPLISAEDILKKLCGNE
jgi:hypothetical protein